MIKTGILGGTFNPVHMGHLLLAELAREEAGLDEIWLIPTGCSYLKDEKTIAGAQHRLRMVELAVADNDKMCCNDIEIQRGGNTYTYETLEELRVRYPDREFYFIVGADCLFSISSWRCPDIIFRDCTLLAAARNGSSMEELEAQKKCLEHEFDAQIRLLTMPNVEISSTEIRERIRQARSVKYMVPDSVLEYINEKGLFKE